MGVIRILDFLKSSLQNQLEAEQTGPINAQEPLLCILLKQRNSVRFRKASACFGYVQIIYNNVRSGPHLALNRIENSLIFLIKLPVSVGIVTYPPFKVGNIYIYDDANPCVSLVGNETFAVSS
jgi:hypothetical protein